MTLQTMHDGAVLGPRHPRFAWNPRTRHQRRSKTAVRVPRSWVDRSCAQQGPGFWPSAFFSLFGNALLWRALQQTPHKGIQRFAEFAGDKNLQ